MIETILSALTILAQLFIILLLLLWWQGDENNALLKTIRANALPFAFIVATVATLGSLYFSNVLGYEPCTLCWYQRILMYPQMLILGVAMFKERAQVKDYILSLSIPGMLISGYHYYLQITGAQSFTCADVGYSVSCSQNFVMDFGYITIPMMAFTAFVLISVLIVMQPE